MVMRLTIYTGNLDGHIENLKEYLGVYHHFLKRFQLLLMGPVQQKGKGGKGFTRHG